MELGDKNGACLDWSKAGELGYIEAYDAIKEYCKWKSWTKGLTEQKYSFPMGMRFHSWVLSYKDITPMVLRKKVFVSDKISMKRLE